MAPYGHRDAVDAKPSTYLNSPKTGDSRYGNFFPIKTKSSKNGKFFIFIFDINLWEVSENNPYKLKNVFQTPSVKVMREKSKPSQKF